ncbi:MAG: HAD-IC family P-type ATPase, partial [Clostridia bacterium]|nr:HAD-IC family P-type ATPase [Clostridia bacterium]
MSDNFITFDDFLKEKGIEKEPQKPVEKTVEEDTARHSHTHHIHEREDYERDEHARQIKSKIHTKIQTEKAHYIPEEPEEKEEKIDFHHDHDDDEDSKLSKYLLIGAAVLFVIGLILKKAVATPVPSAILLVLAAGLAGATVFKKGVMNGINGDVDESVLMTIAVIAAILLGDFAEAAAVAILFRVGEMMEDYASDKSRESIRTLSEIQPDIANVFVAADTVKKVPSEKVKKGTRIAIYPHERVPLDCMVLKGSSTVDASAITGESMPVQVSKGSQILSGSINGDETIVAKTTNNLQESAASRIIQMVEEASSKKSKSQKAITKIANVYTPIVMVLAIIVALIPSIVTHDWATWTHRALVLLVIACP